MALGLTGILLLYGQLSRVSELDVLQSFHQAIGQAALNINDRMAFAEETMRSLLYDARMQESLARTEVEETMENQLKEIKDLREMVYLAEKSQNVTQVRLFLSDAKMITHEGINFFGLSELSEVAEYDIVYAGKGTPLWIGAHPVKTQYFDETCITLGCLYRAYFEPVGRNWAFLLLDISLDYFGESLDALDLPSPQAQTLIVDGQSNVMFGNDGLSEQDHIILSTILSKNAPFGICPVNEQGDIAYATQALNSAGWHIVSYMPRSSLLENRKMLRSILILMLFGLTVMLITLIGCIAYGLYARNVQNYIHGLSEGLKNTNSLERPPPIHRGLLDLDKHIGELLDANQRLTEENYRAQLRDREVTLQVLQAQINPHFLYNTLDSINWMAMREGAWDVSDVIATLAEYFRISLSRGRSIITLREDIEIVRKYLMLYENRYDHQHNVTWDIAENALDCAIPKLTLQPLVENALQHGIFKRLDKTGGLLHLAAAVDEQTLTITIQDNGPGLDQPGNLQKGYGLTNIRERLDLYFGGKHTLSVENVPEGGVRVIVTVQAELLE